MTQSLCDSCRLKQRCQKVGIALDEVLYLMTLVGFDRSDPFALGMAEVTLKNKQGSMESFYEVLEQAPNAKACSF